MIEGESDFKRGFDRLLDRARQENRFNPALVLDEGVGFRIDYWGSFAENKLHPMIIEPRIRTKSVA